MRAEPTAPAGRADAADAILVASGVRKVYKTGAGIVETLVGLDLTIPRGEFLAVMGPSGSGKTTLLNCLSGLDEIDAGTVLVDGEDIHAMSDARRSRHRAANMGFIFQSFNLIPVFTAAENVELPLLLAGASPRDARSRAEATLDRVGLGHRKGHRPNELSGGEQQRVTVARALAGDPAMVWADEPTGNLDTETAGSIVDLLKELNRDGLTLVLVTHDPAIGSQAGRLIQMRDGAVTSEARPAHRTA
ncbi:MAG TPA: ABC transporter ATP-binding protein [Actinomycetota bacterium]|nr:ABC transporter ATP-binding protein [Actinomycetota bacterium]